MEERDVLQHLLHVENEAATLAEDAQSEADKRIAERERFSRETYTARYGARVSELDAEFLNESSAISDEYRKNLEVYRTDLELKTVDERRFAALVHETLFEAN
ncbi:MAG: hypothetical protein WCT14_07660 [Treponemataceae bacterium]